MTFFSSGVLRKILREIYQDPFVLPQTKIIIDCTDVFVQKTTSPSTQRATWSSYKQHNTMKALVGITPTGFFSFISKFWTGNVSDRCITEKSGLLKNLKRETL